MRISRRTAVLANRLLDSAPPPIVRDSRFLCSILMRLLFRSEWRMVMDFKRTVVHMTDDEFAEVYRRINPYILHDGTDLNDASIARIRELTIGNTVVDIGCGRGVLLDQLDESHRVLSGLDVDVEIAKSRLERRAALHAGFAERLPYGDSTFDTVISTHTLEHVRDLGAAVRELRRIARERIIVVVPMQRPYRYTFNLHLHFFPYPESLELAMLALPDAPSSCEVIDGDLLYWEDVAG